MNQNEGMVSPKFTAGKACPDQFSLYDRPPMLLLVVVLAKVYAVDLELNDWGILFRVPEASWKP